MTDYSLNSHHIDHQNWQLTNLLGLERNRTWNSYINVDRRRDPRVDSQVKNLLNSAYRSVRASLVAQWLKNPSAKVDRHRRLEFDPWVGKIPVGGNGNPLQYPRLKNPMDRGSWWVTVRGVAKSWT